jgi:phenylacetate-CoA ligase
MPLLQRVKLAIARRRLSSLKVQGTGKPLEEWIHDKVRKEFDGSPELREAIGRRTLDEVRAEDVRAYQLHRFRKVMEYTIENSPYYRKKFQDAGIKPSDIWTWEDLQKVPMTDPADLAAEPFTFLCVSQSKVMRAFTTSGTTGTRKRMFYTQNDVLNIIDSISAALQTFGMTKSDTLQIMFPAVAAWDPGLMLDGACKVAGLKSVVSSTADVDEQVRTMQENGTTMMIGLTSFIYRITMLAKDRHDLKALGIKTIICSAEPLPKAMRREMMAAWGCPVLSQYGMTEMGLANAIECDVYDGMHTNEADFIVEVVDPETGRHRKEREEGELVWTSLSMEGTPLVRYRSRDLSYFINPPCTCGFRTNSKIANVLGRMDAQTKIGYGQKIYPLLFDEALLSVPGVLGYHLVLDRPDYRDRLTFTVEYKGDPTTGKESIYRALVGLDEIKEALENDLIAPPEIELVEAGSVAFVPKSKTIEDRRPNYDAPIKK